MKNIFSVDVEDWFHILELESTPHIEAWNGFESRLQKNFYSLLDEFDITNTKVTCFFLGWVAEKFPEVVKEADNRGHEIASHGYAHQLIYTQTQQEFSEDITKTKKIIEKITNKPVEGYRAPGFSITKETPWAMEELAKAGYKYDSSIFPASRGHGGIIGANVFPHKINTKYGEIIEFPITTVNILNKRICFFGGGYLRFFPYFIIKAMSKRVNNEKRPVIYYIHPREIDLSHPRLSMGFVRRFKSYYNLKSSILKIRKILREQKLTTFNSWMSEY